MRSAHEVRFSESQGVQLSAPRFQQAPGVGLVAHQHHGRGLPPEPPGHLLVQGRDALAHVHHEQDHVGLEHGRLDLVLHVVLELQRVHDADAARVHQLHGPVRHEYPGRDPVAGHAAHGIHDGDALSGQPVQEGGFAHVGSAHDGHARHLGGRHDRAPGKGGAGNLLLKVSSWHIASDA